ncbi:hypothetical protein EsDP_00002283 [Epichloe bromicola]|uniref:25S rRNA (Uridine(2843)-N(3))-methyltransferase n=1 Tax=Epichloe bromicola TaxID=79588 RepID=A0ABQ0CKC0_9HYPO
MVSKTSANKKRTNRPAKTSKPSAQETAQSPISAKDHDAVQSPKEQQILLNIFSDAFAAVLSSDRFPILLQEIKQALYRRDFGSAFGSEEYLETYAARWSPTRALCYASIFLGMRQYMDEMPGHADDDDDEPGRTTKEASSRASEPMGPDQGADGEASESEQPRPRLRMLCIGGCAAEHVAFASHLRTTNRRGSLKMLDSGPWAHVASLLQNSVTTAPPLSKYASASIKASNKPLLGTYQLDAAFTQADVLELAEGELAEVVGSRAQVVTLLFTLNELYTDGGLGKTTRFLRALAKVLPTDSLLLVVDSPGSYSEAAVGKEKKRYPMQWLLNHTLLESETPEYMWERLDSHDSIWFRIPEGLIYPIQLENMRYQMHLYRIHKS